MPKPCDNESNGVKNEHKLWYLGIVTSLSGSLLVACAVQSANSNGFVRLNWIVCYILADIFFFGTALKAGKIMGVPEQYIRWLWVALFIIVVFGVIQVLSLIGFFDAQ